MKAVVLVGGEGTRLRPLTFSTPKPMLPVAEVTMIERVVAHLGRHGIDEVILSMGYKPDAFLAAFPEGSCNGVRLTYAVEPQRLDTAGGIAFAARLAGLDETFVVMNGDVLSDLDLTELVAFHRERGGEATIALTPVDDPSAFGVVPTDEQGRVTAFIEKPPADEAPTNNINAGFYVFEPSVIDRVPVDAVMHLESEVFPQHGRRRRALRARLVRSTGPTRARRRSSCRPAWTTCGACGMTRPRPAPRSAAPACGCSAAR